MPEVSRKYSLSNRPSLWLRNGLCASGNSAQGLPASQFSLFPAPRLPASPQRGPLTPAVPGRSRPPPGSPDGARGRRWARRPPRPGSRGRCAARALHSLPPPGGSPQESSKQARSGGGSATPRYGAPSSRARGSKARSAGVLAQQPFPGPPRPGRRGALLPRRGRPGLRVGVGTGTGGGSTWPPRECRRSAARVCAPLRGQVDTRRPGGGRRSGEPGAIQKGTRAQQGCPPSGLPALQAPEGRRGKFLLGCGLRSVASCASPGEVKVGGDPGNVLGPPISPRAVVLGGDIDQVKALKVDLSVLLELCLCSLLTARTKLGKVRFRSLKLTSRKGSGLSLLTPSLAPASGRAPGPLHIPSSLEYLLCRI